jgi:hypothetical protein
MFNFKDLKAIIISVLNYMHERLSSAYLWILKYSQRKIAHGTAATLAEVLWLSSAPPPSKSG